LDSENFPTVGRVTSKYYSAFDTDESMHKNGFELVDVTDMGHQPKSITFSI